jgi:hypothetical protein
MDLVTAGHTGFKSRSGSFFWPMPALIEIPGGFMPGAKSSDFYSNFPFHRPNLSHTIGHI